MLGTKILEERRSGFNGNIKIVKTIGMGTYIQVDGLTQSGGIVEDIWRSTLKKIKNENRQINNCLILGLGGGTVAKLIRKNWPEAQITGVDIDSVIVELGEKYLGLDKVGVNIKIQDAQKLVPGRFDLVIVDLYKGDQFPKKFEGVKFFKNLSKNQIIVFNRLYYGDKKSEAIIFGENLKKIFGQVDVFYPQVNLMFICKP